MSTVTLTRGKESAAVTSALLRDLIATANTAIMYILDRRYEENELGNENAVESLDVDVARIEGQIKRAAEFIRAARKVQS